MRRSLRSGVLMKSHDPSLSFQIYTSSKTTNLSTEEEARSSWRRALKYYSIYLEVLSPFFLEGIYGHLLKKPYPGQRAWAQLMSGMVWGTSRKGTAVALSALLKNNLKWQQWRLILPKSRPLSYTSVHFLLVEWKAAWGYSLTGSGEWLNLLVRAVERNKIPRPGKGSSRK